MKRRDFLATSFMVGGLAGLQPGLALGGTGHWAAQKAKHFFELREYRVASLEKRAVLEKLLAEAAVPAWNRLGTKPVGVFKLADDATPNLWVLLPWEDLSGLATATQRLMADPQFVQAAAPLLEAPIKDPLYERIESSLLWGFDEMPRLALPAKGPERLFQLRIYESHNEAKGQKKIEMFNGGGEIAIFLKTGLTPVFFGEALIGPRIPNLTYMLGFENKEQMDAAWKRFLEHPEWLKLKADPQYKDTVSNIANLILGPAAGSQI